MTDSRVTRLLETAAANPTETAVQEAVNAAHQVGIKNEFVPPLLILLRSRVHGRHEDIVLALQKIKDPRAVESLFEAAGDRHEYLDYDEFFGLARKCTWALADIGTPEAKSKLEVLARSENRLIADYAQKRLDRWEEERHRKGAAGVSN